MSNSMTTGQLIDVLVAHYGSTQAVNRAASALMFDANQHRICLKVDALHELYRNINQKGEKDDAHNS